MQTDSHTITIATDGPEAGAALRIPSTASGQDIRIPSTASGQDIRIPSTASGQDRRREPRYPCHDLADVRILRDGSSVPAVVVDISRSGLQLRLLAAIPEHSHIEVVLPKEVVIFGEVRYCHLSGENFVAGVLIQDVFYPHDLHDDQLTGYLAGKGLEEAEVIAVGRHIRSCRLCASRRADTTVWAGANTHPCRMISPEA